MKYNIKKICKVILLIGLISVLSFKLYISIFKYSPENETYDKIPNKSTCLALTYHRVRTKNPWNTFLEKFEHSDELINYSVYKDDFKKEIDKLIDDGAYFATLEEVQHFFKTKNFPDKCVWISFDDGDETTYKNAYPILKEKNIPFTVFVIAGQVGNKNFNNLELMNWDELNEMKDSGLASFGSHTYDMHYINSTKAEFLEPENYEEFFNDIVKSKEVLKENLDINITSIAYPFGDASDQIAHLTSKAGFEYAFILAPHPIESNNDAYYLNRYMVNKRNFDCIISAWES